MDPSQQLNITGLHFASRRLAFFFFFFSPFHPRTCAIVCSSGAAAVAAAAAQGSDSHDAPRLFVLPCGSSARLCLAPPSLSARCLRGKVSLPAPASSPDLAHCSLIPREQPSGATVYFFHPAPVSPPNSAGHLLHSPFVRPSVRLSILC